MWIQSRDLISQFHGSTLRTVNCSGHEVSTVPAFHPSVSSADGLFSGCQAKVDVSVIGGTKETIWGLELIRTPYEADCRQESNLNDQSKGNLKLLVIKSKAKNQPEISVFDVCTINGVVTFQWRVQDLDTSNRITMVRGSCAM